MPKPNISSRIDALQLETTGRLVLYVASTGQLPPATFSSPQVVHDAVHAGIIKPHDSGDGRYELDDGGCELLTRIASSVHYAVARMVNPKSATADNQALVEADNC